jgi:hypothetical protein
MIGISGDMQQALYAALNKNPEQIFPLQFRGSSELATGVTSGQIKGFYAGRRGKIEVERPEREIQVPAIGAKWFRMQANAVHGYPQPAKDFKFAQLYYQNACRRCGIYERQVAPFRFGRSDRRALSGFMQLHWVCDAFFVRPDVAAEIVKAGITGLSFGSAVDHRTGVELSDRVQLQVATIVSCAEISHLPTVTCRPDNEERTEFRRRWPLPPKNESENADPPNWWGGSKDGYAQYKKKVERERARIAALPYCGRVKYHPPTSLAIIPNSLDNAPDLCQSAEWIGSGGEAFRLTLVSERFVALIRERKWKGLGFSEVSQHGFSERKEFKF